MSKWKCHQINCICNCVVNLDSRYLPAYCLCFSHKNPEWKLVQNEPEQKQKNTMPNWCKVGEWVYFLDGEDWHGVYMKIDRINENGYLYGSENDIHYLCAKPARIRPYNAKEMEALVGEVLDCGGNRELVISYNEVGVEVYVGRMWCTAEYLMNSEYTINGKPCGVLEHLDDNGEWVE